MDKAKACRIAQGLQGGRGRGKRQGEVERMRDRASVTTCGRRGRRGGFIGGWVGIVGRGI